MTLFFWALFYITCFLTYMLTVVEQDRRERELLEALKKMSAVSLKVKADFQKFAEAMMQVREAIKVLKGKDVFRP